MESKNVGSRDAWIRGVVALLLLLTSVALANRPLIAVSVGFMGLIVACTALFRTCPLYTLLRINSRC